MSSQKQELIVGFRRRWSFDGKMPSRFPLYAAYLDALEKGQRKVAYEKFAKPLIAELGRASHEERLALIDSIWRATDHSPFTIGSQGFPHQFAELISVPTLNRQIQIDPSDAYAMLWLALTHPRVGPFPDNDGLIAKANQLLPYDPFVCERVAEYKMRRIRFDFHELPSGLFSTIPEAQNNLDLLRKQIPFISASRTCIFENFAKEYQAKLDRYIEEIRPPNIERE
jgi:hypothetical protein